MTRSKLKPAQLGAAHLDESAYSSSRHLSMVEKRNRHLGGSILFYHEPIQIVRGEGVWLFDDQQRKYLDCYNNVASVGHCHPAVVEALTKQAQQLNTHTRYLHPTVINYAEKLAGLMPDPLEVVLFTCTGSEANDLAVRMARNYTGNNGVIVMESSYHGNTTLIDELSMVAHPALSDRAEHVIAVEPPNTYRGPFRRGEHDHLGQRYARLVDEAAQQLELRGQGVAALMCDTIFDTQGTLVAPPDYFVTACDAVRARGGVFIADEVQAGVCRTGKWWGFEHYNVVPDIVVLGKPLGDGHPIGAVVTTRAIADAFTESGKFYFNTYAGNPVSAAVGLQVLELCEQQLLARNCEVTGAYLADQLHRLAQRHPIIGDIRGMGMFLGIELVHDRQSKQPAADIARLIPDALKDEGVLVGMTGRFGNVLKLRPPLVFNTDHADLLVAALDRVLTGLFESKSKFPPDARRPDILEPEVGNDAEQVYEVLTERLVNELIGQGATSIRVTRTAVITPLAQEICRASQIRIQRS